MFVLSLARDEKVSSVRSVRSIEVSEVEADELWLSILCLLRARLSSGSGSECSSITEDDI